MRAYWELAVRGYRRYATYRAATLAGIFTNSIFGLMRGYVLLVLLTAVSRVGGYDARDTLTYVWLTQGLIMIAYLWGWNELGLRVLSGDIAVDLGRPIDLLGSWLAQDLGRALYHALFRGLPPFLLGYLLFRLRLPTDPLTWVLFPISVLLAVVVSFCLRFMVNLAAFWLLDWRGVVNVATVVWTFMSGFVIPISFLPGWAAAAAGVLPFAATVQVPIDVFLEKHSGGQLITALVLQAFWALALLALARLILAMGVRKLVVQGG